MSKRRRMENPDYGPGNSDYEYDAWRQRRDDDAAAGAAPMEQPKKKGPTDE